MTEDEWQLPPSTRAVGKSAVVRTGPSGLLLGSSQQGPVTIRLFRPQGTRLLVDLPDYATWLLAFRAMAVGAHISLISENHQKWTKLAEVIVRQGGTIDLLEKSEKVPTAGRPYRPSLVMDDARSFDGSQAPLGPWQAIVVMEALSAGSSVHSLRNCDMALVAQIDAKGQDNLRRAYVLNQSQLRQTVDLGDSGAVLAMPRKLVRLEFPPTPTEYRALFN